MIAEQVIQSVASRLVDAAPPGSWVILFGSYAKGQATDKSDLDFLVVEPEVLDRHAETWRLTSMLRPMRLPIDVLVASEAVFRKWADAPCNVFGEAAQHGRVFRR